MFTIDCPTHGATVLIWPSGVDAVTNTSAGIVVHYHCTCGHRGQLLTGNTAARAA